MRQIRRYTIIADGNTHKFRLCYDPQAAGLATYGELFFWAEWHDGTEEIEVELMVVTNGEPMPDDALWLCTVQANNAGGAWHLLKRGGVIRDLDPIDITHIDEWMPG